MSAIGHNGFSFDDVVQENLERGLLLAQRDCAARALQDGRLSQRHRVVLAQIILMTNQTSGTTFPGRRHLSACTGYSEAGVAKTISELVDMGYIVSTRKAPEPGRRPLAHYAIVKPTIEELQNVIAQHIEALRRPDVTYGGNVTNGGDVTSKGNVTWLEFTSGRNVTSKPVAPGNVTPVEPTVTSSILTSTETPVVGDAPKQSSHAKRITKGTRISDAFKLPLSWGEWALKEFDVSAEKIRREGENFHRHFKAAAGSKGLKLDWYATWQNWCASDIKAWPRRRAAAVEDGLDLLAIAEPESEHRRQIALVQEQRRQARLEDGLD